MRWRIALVVASRLCAEAWRERFARFRRREWLRRPYRSYSLFVALRDCPLGDAALLEGVLGRRRDGGGSNALHSPNHGGHLDWCWPAIALIGVVFFVAGRDLEQCQQEVFPRRRVALVEALVVPAAFTFAAGRHARFGCGLRAGLAARLGPRGGRF